MRYCPLVAAFIASLALGACANPLARFAPDEAEVVRHGWYDSAPRPVLAERVCYRTLAKVDCHSAPVPGAESRRVGWSDDPVSD
jgi:hypothetical protein